MNTAVLILGIVGLILLVLAIYSYATSGKHFKALASGFLATAVAVFVLVIIKNFKEHFGAGKDQGQKK